MKIQVTKFDINRGFQCDNAHCPVTRAIRRATRYRTTVNSGLGWITVGQSVYTTPPDARRFINDFDDGEPVQPFEFELGEPRWR